MEPASTHVAYHIETSLIYADEGWNCRGKVQPMHLADLASSIQDNGLQIPVIVWAKDDLPNGCKFLLVAGYRRFFACTTLLRQTSILATVRTDLTEETARALNFTENLERKNLNILEEAKAIAIAYPYKITQQEIGRKLNRTPTWVRARQQLLKLPEAAQQAAASGLFTVDDIKLIYSTPVPNRQHLTDQVIAARKEGRSMIRISNNPAQRTLAVKPKVDDIKELMMYLIERGLAGLATKVLLYTIGKMSLEELHTYVDSLVATRLTSKKVQLILEKKTRETKKHVPKRRRIRKRKTPRGRRTRQVKAGDDDSTRNE
jgi:ParB/RepB/Spo0J family partition protein